MQVADRGVRPSTSTRLLLHAQVLRCEVGADPWNEADAGACPTAVGVDVDDEHRAQPVRAAGVDRRDLVGERAVGPLEAGHDLG